MKRPEKAENERERLSVALIAKNQVELMWNLFWKEVKCLNKPFVEICNCCRLMECSY